MQILLQSFSSLSVNTFMSNIRVFLVSGAFIILTAMGLPIAQTHPAKFMLTVVTLHVIAAAVFLYANVALWTLKSTYQTIEYYPTFLNLDGVEKTVKKTIYSQIFITFSTSNLMDFSNFENIFK